LILTGTQISREVARGRITFDPFDAEQVNPNSINYRLGPILKVPAGGAGGGVGWQAIELPEAGYVLEPGRMYLGHTHEVIGSDRYAMSLIGRSSIGRLGLFVQISANLGHTTSCHQWTLELVPARAIRVYPRMRIGQVSFWTNAGAVLPYGGWYGRWNLPKESLLDEVRRPRGVELSEA
jgi:dCTP deaminase